jgi:hypothetical protein
LRVTPETARLLEHWRHHNYSGIRPFFCQVEAVETIIWLTEVAPTIGKAGKTILEYLERASLDANAELLRLALKMATGAGKNTVMAMIIAWQTDALRCHVNWVILDSDWEAEFCRVAEEHPQVRAYAKNHNLGFEVPYRKGSEAQRYRTDFIVLVDDGRSDGRVDPLHLIVEIKGRRGEDAKDKKLALDTFWIPGVNNDGRFSRWASAEFTEVYKIETDFEAKVRERFNEMVAAAIGGQ